MRNIIKTLFLFLICSGLSSCHDEVGYIDPGPQGNPEKAVAGTYVGTWTQTLQSTGAVETGEGTIILTPGDQAYITEVKVSCPDLKIDMESLANIVNNSDGYTYYNQEQKNNGFGVAFQGSVKGNEASIKYTKSIKVGLKQSIYVFTFTGTKQ